MPVATANWQERVIASLARQGKPAIVVGGTGLYLKAIFHGLFPGAPSDPLVRQRLRREAGEKGWGRALPKASTDRSNHSPASPST